MKKYLLIAISLIFFGISVQAEVLQGGVSYDVNSARNELLDGINYTIDSKYVNNFVLFVYHYALVILGFPWYSFSFLAILLRKSA